MDRSSPMDGSPGETLRPDGFGDPARTPGNPDHTQLIHRMQQGDPVAFESLWQLYFERLTSAARKRLATLRVSRTARDEEDVALSVLNALQEGIAKGRFPDLESRVSLWKLLLHLTACKVVDLSRQEGSRRKNCARVLPEADWFGSLPKSEATSLERLAVDDEPSPELVAICIDQLEARMTQLDDPELRRIAELRLSGYTIQEIAVDLGRSPRLINIRLLRIRGIWSEAKGPDD